MELTVSDEFPKDVATSFVADLSDYIATQQRHYVMRAFAGTFPALFQLMATAAEWAGVAVATGFMAKLGQMTAEKVVAEVKRRMAGGEDNSPLAVAIEKAKGAAEDDSRFSIGINFPDDFFGTALLIEGKTLEEIDIEVSLFLAGAERIYDHVKAETEKGNRPFGRAQIGIEEGGKVLKVRWMTQSMKEMHEFKLE